MSKIWVTATVLQLLAERGLVEGSVFSALDLAKWIETKITQAQRRHATTCLCRAGFLTHQAYVESVGFDLYTVTADGAAAIGEAAKGSVRKSGPKAGRKPNPIKPGALVLRLWALVRMRTVIDSDSAARTLCNAGDAREFDRVRDTVVTYLRRWTTAGALEESARRTGGARTGQGFKRFVLKPEWKASTQPPAWREIARQRAAAAAQEAIQP